MRIKLSLLLLLLSIVGIVVPFAQEVPFVYNVENTGTRFAKPVLPSFSDLPVIKPLTDPFEWSNGSGRDTTFTSWGHRRSEIKAEIEKYEIGVKPNRPDTITASYFGGTLTVNVIRNGKTLTLTSAITLPAGDGPFPAVIGMDYLTIPSDIFSSRKVATIIFKSSQVMAHTQTRGNEPINKLYPELVYMGAYSAWSWGVSRLIDGLELVSADLPIDLKHLAVVGCSYAGKMALFAGAFDERIALTIAQEPGGGGAAAWRVSETLGKVETLGNTNHAWFIEDMFKFRDEGVARLPYDHHELMAMVAPRALLVLGNPDYEWLADGSGYVSCRAAHRVWSTFGIPDRFGFSIVGGHPHCALPKSQYPEVEAFVDKFLLGDKTANTNVTVSPYGYVDYSRWTNWWGTNVPEFPTKDEGNRSKRWVGSWSTAPQLVEPHNMPPEPGLSNNTLRQVIRVSLGGDSVRVKFSNEFSTSPVTMHAVQIAISAGGGAVYASTAKELKFNGKSEVTMNPGDAITSDPISFGLKPRLDIAITIFFGGTSPDITGHPGSRTTSYLLAGNQISVTDFSESVKTDHWYIINGIDVRTTETAAAVAILGNSITDGRGSGTNKQNRWPDILSECLLKNPVTQQIAVLNLGIGGNCVLKNCLGPSAIDRFDRDILKQSGVKWVIIFEAINDIGQAPDSDAASKVAKDLIGAYERMINLAHDKGIKVYGATILPFKNSFYYKDYREIARNTVNNWILNSGRFDAVIDFDKVIRNPEDTLSIMPAFHTGDFLHPNEEGYKIMGEAIDLKLFE